LWLLLVTQAAWAQPHVLITFDSVDGHTEEVGAWIAEGVHNFPSAKVAVKKMRDTTRQDVLWADAIIIGSPVYNSGTTGEVGLFLAELPFEDDPLKNKVGAAFVSAQGATAGAENTLFQILKTMMVLRMIVVGGEDWRSSFGVAYILDSSNKKTRGYVKRQAHDLGLRVCKVAEATQSLRGSNR